MQFSQHLSHPKMQLQSKDCALEEVMFELQCPGPETLIMHGYTLEEHGLGFKTEVESEGSAAAGYQMTAFLATKRKDLSRRYS